MARVIIVEDDSDRNRAVEDMVYDLENTADISAFSAGGLGDSVEEIAGEIRHMAPDVLVIGPINLGTIELLQYLGWMLPDCIFVAIDFADCRGQFFETLGDSFGERLRVPEDTPELRKELTNILAQPGPQ